MKTHFLTVAVAILLTPFGANLLGNEILTLETRIYVYRKGDFRTVTIPGAAETEGNRSVIFRSPAKAWFDEEVLSLDGAHFAWRQGQNPPDRFSSIATPAVTLAPGKQVALLSTVPVEYLEKKANGTLQAHRIAADSPDAPHCRLTFTLGKAAAGSEERMLSCDLDLAMLVAREKLPGVGLDVGKPVLARFAQKLAFALRVGEWSALSLQAPGGSDYSLLLLLKIGPENAHGNIAQADRLMTARELDEFTTHYYRNPRPELIAKAIESLGPSGFVQQQYEFVRNAPNQTRIERIERPVSRAYIYTGFFAEVFAANPDRVQTWREVADRQETPIRDLFDRVRELGRPGKLIALNNHTAHENDIFWGAFFASGNPVYLRKLTDQLRYVAGGSGWRPGFVSGGVTAMWSLARNAPEHPQVRPTLEAVRADADPRTRELIDRILTKDLADVRQELLDFLESLYGPAPPIPDGLRSPFHSGPIYDGPRGSGYYGPVGAQNGLAPPR